jgi:hypothetical protein
MHLPQLLFRQGPVVTCVLGVVGGVVNSATTCSLQAAAAASRLLPSVRLKRYGHARDGVMVHIASKVSSSVVIYRGAPTAFDGELAAFKVLGTSVEGDEWCGNREWSICCDTV